MICTFAPSCNFVFVLIILIFRWWIYCFREKKQKSQSIRHWISWMPYSNKNNNKKSSLKHGNVELGTCIGFMHTRTCSGFWSFCELCVLFWIQSATSTLCELKCLQTLHHLKQNKHNFEQFIQNYFFHFFIFRFWIFQSSISCAARCIPIWTYTWFLIHVREKLHRLSSSFFIYAEQKSKMTNTKQAKHL